MARPKSFHIDKDRIYRLFEEYESRGIKMSDISKKPGMPSQTFLSDIKHLRKFLTEETATRIIQTMSPDIRIEWLLGKDEYMTIDEMERKLSDGK